MTERNIFAGDDLEAFEDFLARHGSDKTRWPAADRLAAAGLVARNPDARRLLSEAEALDRLLARASAPRTDISALADRIVAAAIADAPAAQRGWEKAATRQPAPPSPRRPSSAPAPQRFDWRATAAMLAACLMLGAYLGFSVDLVQTVAPGLTQTASQQAVDFEDPAQLALGEDAAGLLEDLL